MAMGKRTPRQQTMWVNHSQLPKGKGHPFYTRLNELLAKDGFDAWAENLCAPFFANSGRPSIPPGVYFRMLFIGYLEGFASDRAIAWNCQDRLSLRAFLGIALHEPTPDHSSLTMLAAVATPQPWKRPWPLPAIIWQASEMGLRRSFAPWRIRGITKPN